jgi:hypothetical protein
LHIHTHTHTAGAVCHNRWSFFVHEHDFIINSMRGIAMHACIVFCNVLACTQARARTRTHTHRTHSKTHTQTHTHTNTHTGGSTNSASTGAAARSCPDRCLRYVLISYVDIAYDFTCDIGVHTQNCSELPRLRPSPKVWCIRVTRIHIQGMGVYA